MKEAPSRDWYVESLVRGLDVIRAFNASQPQMRIAEVAKATGLSRASVRRILMTLVDEGYAFVRDDRYSLAASILSLGYGYLSTLGFPDLARPILADLVARTKSAASIAILDGIETVHICRETEPQKISIQIAVGTRLPAYATSLGRVLLAALDDAELDRRLKTMTIERHTPLAVTSGAALRRELDIIRRQGWALASNQVQSGVGGVSVPISDTNGAVRAALNIQRLVSPGDATFDAAPYLKELHRSAEELSHLFDMRRD